MSTLYSDVTDSFIFQVSDYNLALLLPEDRDSLVLYLMKKAIKRFHTKSITNILDFNDENEIFNEDLSESEIEIISNLMIVEWLKPKLFSGENFENRLSTRDYSEYSPANLLKEIRSTYELADKNARNLITAYTYYSMSLEDRLNEN